MKYHLNVVGVIGLAVLLCGLEVGQALAAPPVVEEVNCDSVYTSSKDQNLAPQLWDLCKATEETWFKSPTDKEALKSKIVMAAGKAWEGKVSDAEQKLSDYEYKLELLIGSAKRKVDVERAENVLKPMLLAAQQSLASL